MDWKPSRINSLFLILSLCIMPPALFSGGTPDRYTFSNAEEAIKQGDLETYKRLKARLGDYPLVPYLEYQLLSNRISSVQSSKIQAYLETYPSTPTADRLREAWLDRLVKKIGGPISWHFTTPGTPA